MNIKGDTEVILMIIFFFVGIALGNEISQDLFKSVIESSVTLAAAFFGAKYAFQLQNIKSKQEIDDRNISSVNRAIFELVRAHNKFLEIERQFINEHRNSEMRHLLILPIAGAKTFSTQFNYDSLGFLFSSSNPDILGTLSRLEQEIASTLDIIEQRSKIHVETLQPAIERIQKLTGPSISKKRIEEEIGPRLTKTLEMCTDFMIDGVGTVLTETREHIDLLQKEGKLLYPGHKIIGMTQPPTTSSASEAPA